MIKKLQRFVLTIIVITTGAHALSKENSYALINQCQYNLKQGGKYDSTAGGVIIGLSQAYTNVISKTGIDNDYAGLTTEEYMNKMCEIALEYRKEQNQKTGGKYDVTEFYGFLINIGYYMTLPSETNVKTIKK